MDSSDSLPPAAWSMLDTIASVPMWMWGLVSIIGLFGIFVLLYTLLYLFAPIPRPPRPSEKQCVVVLPDGSISKPEPLPCWYDGYAAQKALAKDGGEQGQDANDIGAGDCFVSLVVPAYNEEERLSGMLEEAADYLEQNYGGEGKKSSKGSSNGKLQNTSQKADSQHGWEIIIVSDGSTDRTVDTALRFAQTHQRSAQKAPRNGSLQPRGVPPGAIRVVQLEQNRGKGGAVTHGMRHARGRFVVFADADGASRFTDLGKLVAGCERVRDKHGRAVAVGSRAHMVGTEAVVKRSLLRNTLMRAFHLLIRTLTPRKTAAIKDTQCGFKLFTRPALPYIVPYMHSEGWIFDVEMLMLAESASIPMVEVPIGWKEVKGSKLNVVMDSLGMAVGLAVLRFGWGLGIYRRD